LRLVRRKGSNGILRIDKQLSKALHSSFAELVGHVRLVDDGLLDGSQSIIESGRTRIIEGAHRWNLDDRLTRRCARAHHAKELPVGCAGKVQVPNEQMLV